MASLGKHLDVSNWDREFSGWRCPEIREHELLEVRVEGKAWNLEDFQARPNRAGGLIRWCGKGDPPKKIYIVLSITGGDTGSRAVIVAAIVGAVGVILAATAVPWWWAKLFEQPQANSPDAGKPPQQPPLIAIPPTQPDAGNIAPQPDASTTTNPPSSSAASEQSSAAEDRARESNPPCPGGGNKKNGKCARCVFKIRDSFNAPLTGTSTDGNANQNIELWPVTCPMRAGKTVEVYAGGNVAVNASETTKYGHWDRSLVLYLKTTGYTQQSCSNKVPERYGNRLGKEVHAVNVCQRVVVPETGELRVSTVVDQCKQGDGHTVCTFDLDFELKIKEVQ